MKFEDVMTSAEAAERWGISPATVKHACTGQKGLPPRFTDAECRKSKGTWLVTRQGMERLYGGEQKMIKVKYNNKTIATVDDYKNAWFEILEHNGKGSPCIGRFTVEDWEEMKDDYGIKLDLKPLDMVIISEGFAPVVEPEEFDKETLEGLLWDIGEREYSLEVLD